MFTAVLFVITVFLAYSNGSNDNFKGVSTLFGSGALSYRSALTLSTIATVLGSVCSVLLAHTLIQNFSGKGLVPNAVAGTLLFHIAIVSAVGVTVMLATLMGFPISTTHAITGALVGAGLVAVGTSINFSQLGQSFLLPLLTSPLIAIVLGMMGCNLFRFLNYTAKAAHKGWCVCIHGNEMISSDCSGQSLSRINSARIALGKTVVCEEVDLQKVIIVDKRSLLNFLHCLSGGAVCFARAMNDTPKIVALMFVTVPFVTSSSVIIIACGMAIGGIFNSRKVAMTMSKRITSMTETEGLAANLVTSVLVIFSSNLGLPVSTTHVSVGSMVGVGLTSKKLHYGVFGQILLSWILTLPIAASLGAMIYWTLNTYR